MFICSLHAFACWFLCAMIFIGNRIFNCSLLFPCHGERAHTLSLSLFWFENAFSIRGIGSRWCVVLVSLLHLFYTDLIAIYPPINYKTNKHQGIAYHLIWFHCQCARNTKLLFSLITFPFFTFGKLTRVLFVVSLSLSLSLYGSVPTNRFVTHLFFSPSIYCCYSFAIFRSVCVHITQYVR